MGDEAPLSDGVVPVKPAVGEPASADGAHTSAGMRHGPPGLEAPSRTGDGKGDWEQKLPGNWLSRIGVVAIVIGLGFLAKLAYDQGLFGPVPQLVVGLVAGAGMLVAGHHWRRRYSAWAQALSGGGIAVLYLSLFLSYALHQLMPLWATFLLMFVVTAGGVAIALRRDSMAVAIIGIVGAFLVPITLGAVDSANGGTLSGSGRNALYIAYVLTLDVGIVWLASLRNWHRFTLLGLGGSLGVFGWWYGTAEPGVSLGSAMGMLTGIFVCFVAATMLYHGLWRRRPEVVDLLLMTLNAAAYFALSYYLLAKDYEGWLGLFGFSVAGLYAVAGYMALLRSEENRRLASFAFGLAMLFLTVAVPLQLRESYASWIAAAWAVEGAALIWVAVRLEMPRLQVWGLGAFGMAMVGLLVLSGGTQQERFLPYYSDTACAFAITVVALFAAAFFLRRQGSGLRPWFLQAMIAMAGFLTVWLFSAEIVSHAQTMIDEAASLPGFGSADVVRNDENARSLALVGLWVAYGLGSLVVGAKKSWGWLRAEAYGMIAAACGLTMVLLNHSHVTIGSGYSWPVLNESFGGFAICIAALCISGYVISRYRGRLHSYEMPISGGALALANILLLWAMSGEVVASLSKSANWEYLLLVAVWCAHGFALTMWGRWGSAPVWRFGGYSLMMAAVGMAVILLNHGRAGLDRANSNAVANLSFIGAVVCICAIYLSAYVVARNGARTVNGEKAVLTVLVFVTHALALFALSSEVLTYVDTTDGKRLGLTLVWAAYGVAVVVVGILGKWRGVRLGGLVVVVVAILKLFVVDTWTLHGGHRVAAYLIVGVLLVAGGFVYHRYGDAIKGFIRDLPAKGAGSSRN